MFLCPKHLHYVEDVSGFMVFHCCFPVAESVKADLLKSGVFEFVRYEIPAFKSTLWLAMKGLASGKPSADSIPSWQHLGIPREAG